MLRRLESFVDEWIAYHRLLGVDHFYLYDNDPEFSLARILERHAGYATIIPFPHAYAQRRAYAHFLRNFGRETRWVAYIDCDEFINLKRHDSIGEFLRCLEAFDSIAINSIRFGHNGHEEALRQLSLTAFTTSGGFHPLAKSITKTAKIRMINGAHAQYLTYGSVAANANRTVIPSASNTQREIFGPDGTKVTDIVQINHYYLRTMSDWTQRYYRGKVSTAFRELKSLEDNQAKFERFAETLNGVSDESLIHHAPKVVRYLSDLYDFQWRAYYDEHREEIGAPDEALSLHHFIVNRARSRARDAS